MERFHVYRHPDHGYRAVPEGFAIGAAVFQVWWCVIHGMYAVALLVLVAAALCFAVAEPVGGYFARMIVFLLVGVVLGIEGYDLRRKHLIS